MIAQPIFDSTLQSTIKNADEHFKYHLQLLLEALKAFSTTGESNHCILFSIPNLLYVTWFYHIYDSFTDSIGLQWFLFAVLCFAPHCHTTKKIKILYHNILSHNYKNLVGTRVVRCAGLRNDHKTCDTALVTHPTRHQDTLTSPLMTSTISVTVKCSTGDKFTIDVDTKLLVSDFKALLSDKAKIPAAQQRLIFSGHVLKDPQTLESYCKYLLFLHTQLHLNSITLHRNHTLHPLTHFPHFPHINIYIINHS